MASAAMERRWQALQSKTLESYLQEHAVTVYDGIGWGGMIFLLLMLLGTGGFLFVKYRNGIPEHPHMIAKIAAFFAAGKPPRLALGTALVIFAALIVMTDRYEAYHMKRLKSEGERVSCEITGFVKSGLFFYEPLVFFIKREGGGTMVRDAHGITFLDGLALTKGDKTELLYLKGRAEDTARLDRGFRDILQSVLRWIFAAACLFLTKWLFPKKDRPPGPAGPEERRGGK